MKPIVAACVVLLGLAGAALAGDYEDGMAAYQRGDFATAHRLLSQSAEDGHANAQFNLARMYENGEGVARDRVQAHKWFHLSSTGTTDMVLRFVAAAGRDEAAGEMSAQEIAEAERQAQEWVRTHR